VLAPAPTVLAVDDPRLVRVKPEPDLLHPRGDPAQHVLSLAARRAVHDRVVGVALEWAARMLAGHPNVERVVHEQVRQDRRNGRSLRRSSRALNQDAVRVLQRRCQPPLDIQQHPGAVGHRLHRADDEVPRHLVEELLDVEIDRPVELPAPLPACRERVVGRPVRPVAIGVRVEHRLHKRLQEHGHHRLRDPVCDRRHTQHSDPAAVRLRDLYRPDRGRKVRPRTHPIPDLVEVVHKIGPERLKVLPVHSRRALVGFDLPPRLPHHPLGNRKRLVLRPCLVHFPIPPDAHGRRLIEMDIPGEPAPSLRPHPSEQELHRYYEPVRQRAPQLVLNASGFRRRQAPSRDL